MEMGALEFLVCTEHIGDYVAHPGDEIFHDQRVLNLVGNISHCRKRRRAAFTKRLVGNNAVKYFLYGGPFCIHDKEALARFKIVDSRNVRDGVLRNAVSIRRPSDIANPTIHSVGEWQRKCGDWHIAGWIDKPDKRIFVCATERI